MRKKFTLITVLAFLLSCFSARSQWVQTTTAPGGSVWGLVTIGTNLFAGASNGGIYFSPDDGDTWIQRSGAFPNMEVYSLVTNGTDLFAGTGGLFGSGIYKSSDQGMTWVDITPASLVRTWGIVRGLAINGTDIYMCSDQVIDGLPGTGIFKSSIPGIDSSSWTLFNNGIPLMTVLWSLKVNGTNIYAGTYGKGVWVSSTSSPGWSSTSGMASDGDYITAMSFNGGIGFAGNISGSPVLYRSVDNGLSWAQSSTSVFDDKPIYAIVNDATTVYAGTSGNGVLQSKDNGISWTTFNEGFKDSLGNWFCNQIDVQSLAFKGNTIFAGTGCGVWKRQLAVTPVPPVTVSDSLIHIYPNPSSNTITLKVGRDDIGSTCIIKDAFGTILLQKQITNETISVEISGLPAGMYFIQVGHKRAIKLMKR